MFSSAWEQAAGFTRDYSAIKAALNKIEDYDKTCIEAGLNGVGSTVSSEWGNGTMMQVQIQIQNLYHIKCFLPVKWYILWKIIYITAPTAMWNQLSAGSTS